MKRIIGFLAGVAILLFLSSGILSDAGVFFEWYFKLKYTQPNVSDVSSVVVRVLTFIASFSLVGMFFGAVGWFDKKAMKIAYAIVSTILNFVFAYVIWKIEEHIITVIIVLSIVFALAIAFLIICLIFYIKEKNAKDQDW